MSAYLQCIIGRNFVARQNSFGVLRNHPRRFLCSSADKGNETKSSSSTAEEQSEAIEQRSENTVAKRSPDVLEAVRNFKPPNADDYAVQKKYVEDETGLDYPGGNFSKSLAYQMSVREALGVSKEEMSMHRRTIRLRSAIYASLTSLIIYLMFFLPGEEEIDEVTGEIYRQPPGYVDLINDLRMLQAYLSDSNEKPKTYVWTPS